MASLPLAGPAEHLADPPRVKPGRADGGLPTHDARALHDQGDPAGPDSNTRESEDACVQPRS